MDPERSFIKLKNVTEVGLLNDGKETAFLEATFSKSHPQFRPTQYNNPLKVSVPAPKKKPKKCSKTFRRQGMRSLATIPNSIQNHRPQRG